MVIALEQHVPGKHGLGEDLVNWRLNKLHKNIAMQ